MTDQRQVIQIEENYLSRLLKNKNYEFISGLFFILYQICYVRKLLFRGQEVVATHDCTILGLSMYCICDQ